ncbi:7274_t:CDS:2 [Gigaspora margarita]|uniref:7274_t:CDS:1 n=1 Tax=Gigaspora margarita TaxID=4874 RepID=A0ABN7UUP6_GIGMA|nr:7274_t:CDS:2 [Gigaspora margarita]
MCGQPGISGASTPVINLHWNGPMIFEHWKLLFPLERSSEQH